MKIDIFPHILPAKYREALYKEMGSRFAKEQFFSVMDSIPTLWDLDCRFRVMDKFDGLMQVLTLGMPPVAVDDFIDPQKATDLAKLANDEMAELVLKYPDRFAAAVACLPMNNMDAALEEIDRAIKDLKLRGVQIFTPTNDKPIDSPEFMPLYEKMCQYNLPIWLHPNRALDYPDYRSEKTSKYNLHAIFGWPYETSIAMGRLVVSGIMEKYPGLKIITHHAGAMIPFLEKRLTGFLDGQGVMIGRDKENFTRPTLEYFKMFYADTALYGHTDGLMGSYAFFGAEHLLFGTDMPWDNQLGLKYTRETIVSVEQMAISDAEKKMIFEDNARSLLRLPV
jgi:predicted TIM-barrel fold metal-dependent hydrolase